MPKSVIEIRHWMWLLCVKKIGNSSNKWKYFIHFVIIITFARLHQFIMLVIMNNLGNIYISESYQIFEWE